MSLLPKVMRIFYRTNLQYLPVVAITDAAETQETQLYGFLSRTLLNRSMADLERIQQNYEALPENLLIRTKLPADLMAQMTAIDSIPVLNTRGEQITIWKTKEILQSIAAFTETTAPSPETPNESPPIAQDTAADWLSQLILSGFPEPLYAADLSGQTLFYNEAFERLILRGNLLKNSIRLAEQYFLEITRNMLINHYSQKPATEHVYRIYLKEFEIMLETTALEADGQITGYLYIFRETAISRLFYEVPEHFTAGFGLDTILTQIESGIIQTMLERNGQNISHTAKALKIRRSTLQNKIKRFLNHHHKQTENNRKNWKSKKELRKIEARGERFVTEARGSDAPPENDNQIKHLFMEQEKEEQLETTSTKGTEEETTPSLWGAGDEADQEGNDRQEESTGGDSDLDDSSEDNALGDGDETQEKSGKTKKKSIKKSAAKKTSKKAAVKKKAKTAKKAAKKTAKKATKKTAVKKKAKTVKKAAKKTAKKAVKKVAKKTAVKKKAKPVKKVAKKTAKKAVRKVAKKTAVKKKAKTIKKAPKKVAKKVAKKTAKKSKKKISKKK